MLVDTKHFLSILGLILFVFSVPACCYFFLGAYVGDYKAGRWKETRNQKPSLLGIGAQEESCFAAGMLCIFSMGITYAKSNLSWWAALPLGFVIGVGIVLFLSMGLHVFHLAMIWIVEKMMSRRK